MAYQGFQTVQVEVLHDQIGGGALLVFLRIASGLRYHLDFV